MTKENISRLFDKFNTFNVLIIGDLMIDSYLWGNVNRISPEAPIPIVECKKREHRLGGAANVALNISSLGANPILCSVVGNDDKSKIVFELLDKREMSNEGIVVDDSRITTIKFRVISEGQHILRVDEENTNYLDKNIEQKFIDNIKEIIARTKIDAIIFEDYDKGVISKKVIDETVKIAVSNNIPTLADPKKRNFNFYKNLTLFKPNFKELTEGLKVDIDKDDIEKVFEVSKNHAQKTNNEFIMTTLSENGICIANSDSYHHVNAEKRDIIDVSGAGDTVIATSSLCLASGVEPKYVAEISNISGGLVCEKVGVLPINKDLLKTEVLKIMAE